MELKTIQDFINKIEDKRKGLELHFSRKVYIGFYDTRVQVSTYDDEVLDNYTYEEFELLLEAFN